MTWLPLRHDLPPRPLPSTLSADFVGEEARLRMTGRRGAGKVHSVHEGAINLVFDKGLVTIVPRRVGRGPINITVGFDGSLNSFGLTVDEGVGVVGDSMDLGGGRLLVSLGSTKGYRPGGLRRKVLAPRLLWRNMRAAGHIASTEGNTTGLGGLIALLIGAEHGRATTPMGAFDRAALPGMASLEEAANGSPRKAREAALELVGLGPGLTPSADDMLSGMLLILSVFAQDDKKSGDRVTSIAREILAGGRGRTTLLSYEHLALAARGRGGERTMGLCRELLTGTAGSVGKETRRVIAIGETSGTDTVVGMLLGMKLLMKWRGSD